MLYIYIDLNFFFIFCYITKLKCLLSFYFYNKVDSVLKPVYCLLLFSLHFIFWKGWTSVSFENSITFPLFLNTCKFEFKKTCAYDVYVLFTEAHDALHNFSCKMLASRKCDECEYKEGEQPLTTNKDS